MSKGILGGGLSGKKYILKLYITGATPHSMKAVANIKRICDSYLPQQYSLETIDIYQQPEMASTKDIIAVPTLVLVQEGSTRRLIGDLSDTVKVLHFLEVELAEDK